MTDNIDNTEGVPAGGLDRRAMLKRTALVGGALVWATPVVQSIGGTAFASTVGSPGGGGFPPGTGVSEVTILINCGGVYTWVKFNPQNQPAGTLAPSQCNAINVAQSNPKANDGTCTAAQSAFDTFLNGKTMSTDCSGQNATVDASGSLCFSFAGCTLVGYTLHDGAGTTDCYYTINGTSGGSTSPYNIVATSSSLCVSKT